LEGTDVDLIVVIGIVALVLVLALFLMYNTLVGRRNQVDNAFASIDALLKKRYDLIPNLVATVQQYATHERELLTSLTDIRARALAAAPSPDQRVQLDSQLSQALRQVMVVAENYPDLKASQNFVQLQGSLNEVEEQISAARRAYNAAVTSYNNSVQMMPTSLIAGMFNFAPRTLFEIPEAERQNVDVGALFKR
jgi:LemA protein